MTNTDDRPDYPPPTWGDDELTKYFEAAKKNQWATFWNKRQAVARLISADALFVRASKDWLNPKSEVCALLLQRSHAAFRATCQHAMAGQVVDSHVQCRAALEAAAYAVHIHSTPGLDKVWINRHLGAGEMKAQKASFLIKDVQASIAVADRPAAQRFSEAYQLSIDLGGHPNERSVTTALKIVDEGDRRQMYTLMQHGEGLQLDHSLKIAARCGFICLELLQIVFSARFELLGITHDMREARRGI